jgi:hypothetical protein
MSGRIGKKSLPRLRGIVNRSDKVIGALRGESIFEMLGDVALSDRTARLFRLAR